MQITHEEAMQLIEYLTDKAVHGNKEAALNAHLKDCALCRAHAHQFSEMENILQRTMRKHWYQHPALLSIDALVATKNIRKNRGVILITRTALISVAFMAFVFIGWQFALTNKAGNGIYPGMLLPVPTPSTQSTATTSLSLHCEEIRYQVQEHDTLENIAHQHTTTKESIMSLNKLSTETIHPAMELLIPICKSTATSTTYPPTFTITPILEPITYTPG